MKKPRLLLLFVLAVCSASFSQKNKIDKDLKTYSRVWDNVVNNRQIDQINKDNFDSNITLVASPQNVVGIEGFKAYYQNYLTGFSDIEFTIVDLFGQGDKIAKHWNFKGKHTGEFFGIPGTGKSVDIDGVTLAEMKNGKIVREQDFMDNTVFMQQLGLLSDPENINVIDSVYKAFGEGDIPTVLGLLDTQVEWNEAEGNAFADGNPYIGPDAVLNGVFARIGAEHEYFKLVNIQLHEMANNQVLATLRYNAKLKKNGALIDAQVAHLWKVKDRKVIGFQQYVDTKQLDDALDQ
jgi:steroid delta-isomerase-like uncharacterized protein